MFYGVALRESGGFDIYCNMNLVDSVTDPDSNFIFQNNFQKWQKMLGVVLIQYILK